MVVVSTAAVLALVLVVVVLVAVGVLSRLLGAAAPVLAAMAVVVRVGGGLLGAAAAVLLAVGVMVRVGGGCGGFGDGAGVAGRAGARRALADDSDRAVVDDLCKSKRLFLGGCVRILPRASLPARFRSAGEKASWEQQAA